MNPMLDADDASVYLSRGGWVTAGRSIVELKLKVSKLAERQRISEEKKKAKKAARPRIRIRRKEEMEGRTRRIAAATVGAQLRPRLSSSASSVKSRKGRTSVTQLSCGRYPATEGRDRGGVHEPPLYGDVALQRMYPL